MNDSLQDFIFDSEKIRQIGLLNKYFGGNIEAVLIQNKIFSTSWAIFQYPGVLRKNWWYCNKQLSGVMKKINNTIFLCLYLRIWTQATLNFWIFTSSK